MVKINPQFEDADDDRLAQILAASYGAPPIRAGFAERLEHQLDAEFATLHGKQTPNARAAAAPVTVDVSTECLAPVVTDAAVEGSDTKQLAKRARKWRVLFALAASLAVGGFFLSDPP